jgi:translation elongation factor EF-1beta
MSYLNKDAIDKEEYNLKVFEYHHSEALKRANRAHEGLEKVKRIKLLPQDSYFNEMRDLNAKELAEFDNEVAAFQTKVEGARLNLKRLKGEPIEETAKKETPKDLSGESEDGRKNRQNKENEEKKHLENLKDIVEKHRSDLRQQEMRDDERDAERIKEKYRQQIEDAKELEKSKQKEVASGAHTVRLQLEGLMAQELEAKQVENTEKRITKLKEIEMAAIAAVHGLKAEGLDKELAAISAKFDAKVADIRKIVKEDPSAQNAGTAAELAIEEERQAAIVGAKNKFNDALVAQIVQFQNDVFQLHADDEMRELAALEVKYNELMAKAVKYKDGEVEILKWYEDQKTKIHNESAEKRTKKTTDETKKQADITKKVAEGQLLLQQSSLQTLQGFTDLAGAVLGDAAKKTVAFVALQKTLAAIEMYLNMGREIAGYYAAYAAIPGGPAIATALAAQAKIRTTINIASMFAQALIPSIQQKYDGGEVVGASDGKRYNPKFYGQAQTGYYPDPSLFLTSEKGGEYVIAYPETQDPIVANFLPYLEASRQRRVRGFADGGSTVDNIDAPPTPSVSAQFGGQQMVAVPVAMFERFMAMTEGVMSAFEKGIVLGFEDVEHIDKMRSKIQNVRGYN